MKGIRYILQYYTHQGSVAALTDGGGQFYQHLQYLPYGEVLVDKHRGRLVSPYTFSAKEKDAESGYNYFGARYYTDNIMMWLSVDPMSDKYPSMSPYMYCAGNPIMINDPNGDTLAINYRGTNIIYNNGSLYNSDGSLYTGKVNGYLKAAVGAIESLNGTAEGESIVSELQNSDNMFVITKPGEDQKYQNGFKASNSGKAMANLEEYKSVTGDTRGSNGSGGKIYWDPYIITGGVDVNGNTIRPAFIGLGHEMCHASDANNGLLYNAGGFNNVLSGEVYNPMYNGLPKAEWRATSRENRIREQANQPLRMLYSSDGSGPSLLGPRNKYCY